MGQDRRRGAGGGCGGGGARRAALFLAHGIDVMAHDPSPGAKGRLREFVTSALAQLAELGHRGEGQLLFQSELSAALEGADLVQENAPEDEALKRRLLVEIDARLPLSAI